jgi:RimJ/RimL family protein N-acetyltransferase
VTLTGRLARLEPLSHEHARDLLEAARHDDVWTYLDEPTPSTLPMLEKLITEALEEQKAGKRLPWAVIALDSEQAIGSVSFIDIRARDRGVEIGWGWLTPSRWRTGIGREMCYLLLRHAFEDLGVVRVALKTDVRNERSRAAILGLGAQREGVVRNHMVLRDGYIRDSVYFSVTVDDWPAVRAKLRARP